MENRKDKLAMYSNLDLLKIFENCNSVSELAHAGSIFLMLIEDGLISDKQKDFIFMRIQIRKRQF